MSDAHTPARSAASGRCLAPAAASPRSARGRRRGSHPAGHAGPVSISSWLQVALVDSAASPSQPPHPPGGGASGAITSTSANPSPEAASTARRPARSGMRYQVTLAGTGLRRGRSASDARNTRQPAAVLTPREWAWSCRFAGRNRGMAGNSGRPSQAPGAFASTWTMAPRRSGLPTISSIASGSCAATPSRPRRSPASTSTATGSAFPTRRTPISISSATTRRIATRRWRATPSDRLMTHPTWPTEMGVPHDLHGPRRLMHTGDAQWLAQRYER